MTDRMTDDSRLRAGMTIMKNILFVCTGNSCRSVMAEGLFRKIISDRPEEFFVASAGLNAADGLPAAPEAVDALKAEGVDVSHHKSRRLTHELLDWADKILVMEKIHEDWILGMAPSAKDKVGLLTEYSSDQDIRRQGNIPDPIRMPESFYRNVMNVIRDCVKNMAEKF